MPPLEHVTCQVMFTGTAVLMFVVTFSWVCVGEAGLLVQPIGTESPEVTSAWTLDTGPLLCSVVVTVTLKGWFTLTDEGAEPLTLTTFRSVVAVIAADALPLPLAPSASATCCWSIVAAAFTLNTWFDGLLQVTLHDAGEAGTVVFVETGSDVFWTTTGLADEVVQSLGRLSVSEVSTFAGP